MSAIFGEILTFGQQTGPDIQLRVFGDEYYARYETIDGFSVTYDEGLGLYCYATLSAGAFRSTGISPAQAVPSGLVRHLQETGDMVAVKAGSRRARRIAQVRRRVSDAVVRAFGPNQGLLEGRVLSTGNVKGLTILVEFQDVTTTVTKADVEEMLNSDGYTRNGNICSAREYFQKASSGKLNYTNVVVGPYKLSRNRHFYVNNLLVEEALQLAVAAGVDLTQFDSRGDGIVDALNFLYAGQTQYNGELWPHNWRVDLQHGTMLTDLYLLTSLGRTAADLSIGTFCHENGHLLCRFPDLYDYGERDSDSMPSAGIGMYCLMGAGNHLNFGRSPSPVCAYLRDLVGWCDKEVDLNTAGAKEARHGDYSTVLKFRTAKPSEYFLVENRSKMGLDRDLPSSGLAVYHCDILGSNELQEGSPTRHYQCALLQADGHRDLEMNGNSGDSRDLYGETAGIGLSAESVPHSREWDGRDSGLVLSDISAPGATIRFAAGASAPAGMIARQATPNVAIPDDKAGGVSDFITVDESGTLRRIKVSVDIAHPYIGDLRVVLTAPSGRSTLLHAQLGGSNDNIAATYDSAALGELAALVGQPIKGNWTLNVSDRARRDVGIFRSWGLELTSVAVGGAPTPTAMAPAAIGRNAACRAAKPAARTGETSRSKSPR
jgi:M6 family metalloprotease-like protein